MNGLNGMKIGKYPHLFLIITLIFIFALAGCRTYTAFSGDNKGLDFTFEYPEDWRISGIREDSESAYFNILGPIVSNDESPIFLAFYTWFGLGNGAEQDAQKRLSESITADSKQRNFSLVRQETANLDGSKSYQAEYTADFASLPRPEVIYLAIKSIRITVPREGKVYEILISAGQNQWNNHEKDIQHVLDTFKWK